MLAKMKGRLVLSFSSNRSPKIKTNGEDQPQKSVALSYVGGGGGCEMKDKGEVGRVCE